MERAHARYWEMCGAPSALKKLAGVVGYIMSAAFGYIGGLYITQLLIVGALMGGVPLFLVWALNIIGVFLSLTAGLSVGELTYKFIMNDGYKAIGAWFNNKFRKEGDHAAA